MKTRAGKVGFWSVMAGAVFLAACVCVFGVTDFVSYLKKPRLRGELLSQQGEVLGFGPEEGQVVVKSGIAGRAQTIQIRNLADGTVLFSFSLPYPDDSDVTLSPDGGTLIAAGPGGEVRVWDLAAGEARGKLRPAMFGPTYSPDGKRILGLAAANVVVAVDISHLDALTSGAAAAGGARIRIVADPGFAQEGRAVEMMVAGAGLAGVAITEERPRYEFRLSGQPDVVEWCRYEDGSSAPRVRPDVQVAVVDLETSREIGREFFAGGPPPGCPSEVPWAEDEGRSAVEGDLNGDIVPWLGSLMADAPDAAWDGVSFTVMPDAPAEAVARNVDYVRVSSSSDGRYLFVRANKMVRVWDTTGGGTVREFQLPQWGGFGHGPDGHSVAVASREGVDIWDVPTGDRTARLTGHEGLVRAVRYSPDGRWLLTAGEDGAVVWDAATGEMQFRIQGEGGKPDMLLDALFSPDGRYVITQEYSVFHVWEVAGMGQ